MKYLRLLVTLAVVGMLLSTVALASKAKGPVTSTNSSGGVASVQSNAPGTVDPQAARLQAKVDFLAKREADPASVATLTKYSSKMAPVAAIPRPALAPFAAPLSGTYQVGTGGDYPTLTDAANALNANGVSGAVIMELKDATYNSVPIVIGSITGASATNTITFRPKAGTAVTVNFSSYAGFGSGITIVDAAYITIDGVNSGGSSLTLTYAPSAAFPSGDANSATVLITGTSNHIAVKNSTIFGMTNDNSNWNNVSDARQGVHVPGTGLAPNHITISGNNIGRSYYGIAVAHAQNVTISNNNLGAAAFGGGVQNAIPIFVYSTDSLTVTGNQVKGNQYNDFFLNATGDWNGSVPLFDPLYTGPSYFVTVENAFVFGIGVVLTGSGSVIANNVIDDYNAHMDVSNLNGEVDYTQYGLRDDGRSTSQRPLVYNNRVSRIYSDNDYFAATFAHRIRFANVYQNSVYLSGASRGYNAVAARPDQACDVENNAWFADLTLGPFRSFGGVIVYSSTHSGISDHNALGIAGSQPLDTTGSPGPRKVTAAGTLAQHIVSRLMDSASVQGNPEFTSATDLHINTALASAASDIGRGGVVTAADVDGDARSVTTPDAGADEYTGLAPAVDLAVGAILAPTSSGFLTGTGTQMKALVKNSANAPKTFDLRMYVDSATTIVYDQTVTGNSIAALGVTTVTMPTMWTPLGSSGYKVVAKIQPAVAGDIDATNDSLARTQTIAFALSIPYSSTFNTSGSAAGWSTTGSWVRGAPAKTHISGTHQGAACFVTGTTAAYTAATLHTLKTPYFNLTGQTSVYIGWFQSLVTEPEWDRMVLQYTLDTGKTWTRVGNVNDANGINWYNTSTYTNAGGPNGFDCYDSATARTVGFDITPVPPGWTSNGDCTGDDLPTGPFGWVFVQYHFNGGHPVLGQPLVGFRMAAFSDAGTTDEGWAVDDFFINTTGNPLTGSISGKVYLDNNGNSTFDGGDAGLAGRTVHLTGSAVRDTVTDGSGNYAFTGLLAGAYTVTYNATLPMGLTQPVGDVKTYDMLMAPGDVFASDNFGEYNGGVTGIKFDDMNLNNVLDAGDHGLGDWVIEAHKDSLNGLLYASTHTDSGTGAYNLRLGAGIFYIVEVPQAGWTSMFPPAGYFLDTIVGTSGTTNISGQNFGNAELGSINVSLTADLNGDGTIIPGDNLIAFNAVMQVVLLRNNVPFDTLTLGSGVPSGAFTDLGVGTYKIVHTPPAGFVQTAGGTPVFSIFSSGVKDTCRLYDFGLMSVDGVKFEDHNGNGVQDSVDQGLAGWKIRITGPKADSAITDASGHYTISGLPGGGDYTLSEDVQAGWTKTKPATTYLVSSLSGQHAVGKDFGNFKLVTLSGKKYRDQNNSGSFDGNDVGLSGWTINASGVGSTVSDGNGDWSFAGVGPGTDTVTEVSQLGYVLTEPSGGKYVITTSSGVDVANLNFGNFNIGDSNQYRTWTVSELSNALEVKPKKRPKAGKPILYAPNSGNLLEDMLKFQGGILRIGLTGQLNIGGKEKAYLQPAKQGDAFATFNKKGAVHTGANRGFDVDIKGKLLLKRFKSLPSTKKNDVLLAELLALKINVLASELGKTPAGLGALEINRPGNPYSGKTIDDFLAYMDTIMTNWDGQPYYLYDSAASIAAALNGAFSTGSTSDTTATGGWTSPKLKWVSPIYLVDRPVVRHGATIKAKAPVTETVKPLPTVFALNQNYPNPFNPSTTISFDLPEDALVTLKLYNIVGQEVATLYNREEIGAGTEDVEFDASSLPSGVYIYRLVAERLNEDGLTTGQTFTQVKKMMLVK